jgi:Zn-dependent M28 family amino/carboxypeptidase
VLLSTLVLAACASAIGPARPSEIRVDAARMMRVAGALAHDSMQGRAVGTEGGAKARRLVIQELTARGIAPLGASYEHPFTFTGRSGTVTGVNVLAVVRGTEVPDRYIVATAHYDHVGVRSGSIYNGADDNASGTVALLELASWFRAHPPRHSIVIAALDAEETGLRGARAFLEQAPVPIEAIGVNINMDMVGRNDRNELYAVGTRYYPVLRPFVEQAAARSTITLRLGHDSGAGGEDWTMMSDQGPFHQRGIRFLYFGVEDHPDYHRPTDDAERLQPAFLEGAARTVIDVVTLIDGALENLK